MEYRKNLRELMKDKAHLAIEYMFAVLEDPKTPVKLGVAVSQDIEDRYYGKAVDRIAIATIDGASAQDTATMTDIQLQAILNKVLPNVGNKCIDGEVIKTKKKKAK